MNIPYTVEERPDTGLANGVPEYYAVQAVGVNSGGALRTGFRRRPTAASPARRSVYSIK